MSEGDFPEVLFEDNHLLAVNKPAGILSMGDQTGDRTMVDRTADYLKHKYNKPGNVFVGVVHRLDRPVSGVLLFARTSKAASRLSDQFRTNKPSKWYRAIVEGRVSGEARQLTHCLAKDRRTNTVSVVDSSDADGRVSQLEYRVVDRTPQRSVLDVRPMTGRSHQIRVQLAAIGHPIAGDNRYGAKSRTGGRILLHARSLQVIHPTQKEPITIEAPLPIEFETL